MRGIGSRLRTIRREWRLSLREVEKRSLRLVQEKGNQSYRVSASWLDRLEREEHELSVTKLMALAEIYNVSPDQLLRCVDPGSGALGAQAEYLLQETPVQPVDQKTSLLAAENGSSQPPYRLGIIGKNDLTLHPMIPAGSIVQIETQKTAISTRTNWTHEFQRPIYFLMTREAYYCGWCELDRNADWLTLIPYFLSPAPTRRWRYRVEIESIGRVVGVAIPLAI